MNEERNAVTVLYVDDEDLARKYFVRAYQGEFDVLEADGVDAALALLDGGRQIDVLVTDYRMPQRLGGELLRHVELYHPHIVRILVTAFADKDVLLDTVNGGEIFRVLEKPLDMAMLRSTLHLAGQRARERSSRRATLKAIEEALAFLAHELNTPLATIANFARGIQRRSMDGGGQPGLPADPGEMAAAAAQINENARYCQTVLNSFVDSVKLASSAAGRLAARPGSSARQLLASLLEVYPLTPAQRASISLEVRRDFAVAALPNCVALVLSSVLSNALRAVDGHPAPALSFKVQAGARPQIHLTDNGSGIPPEILGRLLRDPITMHADGGGSGWGLIFCNRIMQSFGGSIAVTSEHGRYTTVALNFPVLTKEYNDDRP
ncbi:MAG TPA: hybrid sensor histidine kinase/response regulator [Janthinobacterium sp.]|jgi:two-component system response regulator PhcR|nr:hybrid sensor histidine kinase/response regulator [Janthinobacterium sp.]